MTEAEAVELVSGQMATQWPVLQPTIPLVLENEGFPAVDSFVMQTLKHTGAAIYTMGPPGTRRTERRGWIFVKLWGPANVGRKGVSTLADSARTVFAGQQLGSADVVTIGDGLTQEIGVDGRWYMSVVQLPFRYYGSV